MRIARLHSVERVGETAWRALEPPNFPFFDFEFLRESGWSPVYLVCEDGGRLTGAFPVYLKTDSYGEYIFDWDWAHAYHEHGLPYYPKLVAAVPFTPATGPKLLSGDGVNGDRKATTNTLLGAARELGNERGVSSSHALFVPERELGAFEENGFAVRHSFQFHWRNPGYGSFDDYLEALEGKRRRQISRERRQLADENLVVERLTGEDLGPEHAKIMYGFYLSTFDRKWGFPYLTEEFFYEVFRTMKDRTLLALARDAATGRPIAGALNFFKGDSLYGRYWGATEERRNLHFELCYYQAIEFAIERGLALFEAGAQGEHKLARGFLPTVTYSAHEIRHPVFRQAIERYIAEEREYVIRAVAEYNSHAPYRI
jgi:predicted N-acyltransferase